MKELSEHAAAAKAIRKELKTKFPQTKFRVASTPSKINVYWDNGPTSSELSEVTNKYECGHFNGMEDIYEMSNRRDDLPQVHYLFLIRDITSHVMNLFFEQFKKTHSVFANVNVKDLEEWSAEFAKSSGYNTPYQYIRAHLTDKTLYEYIT